MSTKSKKGFTIIEVVLVLAIAGLIFLMVFIAWPALQRSQKDTQRRNDYSLLSTAISNYSTNNNGKLEKITGTGEAKLEPKTYINETGEDPDGYAYDLIAVDCNKKECSDLSVKSSVKNQSQKVYVAVHADCTGEKDGGSAPKKNGSSRAFAIYGYLEGGNGTFCSASQ